MSKILWFEGAGMDGTGQPVGNCRIRTVFCNDEGTMYYLELTSHELTKEQRRFLKDAKEYKGEMCVGWVGSCHEITDDPEIVDSNERRHDIERDTHFCFHWTFEGILDLVNDRLGCSFDEIRIAPKFSGYTPFAGRRHGYGGIWADYNRGDQFVPDMETVAKMRALYDRERARQVAEGERYPCVSVLRDGEDPGIVHVLHFNKRHLPNFDVRLSELTA